MATLDKLIRTFDAVKVSQTVGGNVGHSGGVGGGREAGGGGTAPPAQEQHTSTMASLASSLTQQGQGLLSKKELVLNSRDKVVHCSVISDALIGAKGGDIQKLLSVGIETLLLLTADPDQDVQMNANEALNRVIRGLSETQLGKIQVELYKEIKKNGNVKSLRAALTRFAALCHHIRPQKCRAYVQNLLPYLTRMAKRPEELLLETLANSLDKIMPTLGHFTNDNEIRNLLKAFLPNMSSSSSAVRRSAVSSLIVLCLHSRKPHMFHGWLLNTLLQTVVPIHDQIPTTQVLGCLMCLRSLIPHISELCAPHPGTEVIFSSPAGTNQTQIDYTVSYDQIIQVYEICIHYSAHSDHNIVTASLEALQMLLSHLPAALLLALSLPEGITRSRIMAEQRSSKLSSRAESTLSIAPSLFEEDNILDAEGQSKVELESMGSIIGSPGETADGGDGTGEGETQEGEGNGGPEDSVDSGGQLEEVRQEEDDKGGGSETPGEGVATAEGEELLDELSNSVNAMYSSIEIGKITDESLLLGRSEICLNSEHQTERKKRLNSVAVQVSQQSLEEKLLEKVGGNIGSFYDEDVAVKYLGRYLASSFLLSGHCGSLIPDRTVRVSVKVLALNCLGLAVTIMPQLLGESLYINVDGETELVQHIDDVLRYHAHSDPQLSATVGTVVGQYIRASLIHGRGHYQDPTRPSLALASLLNILCKLLGHESSVTARGAVSGLGLCLGELVHTCHASSVLRCLPHIVNAANNPYWLVKVELCELISGLPLSYIDHVECNSSCCSVSSSGGIRGTLRQSDRFSHRVLTAVFIPLLADIDQRVRLAAAVAVVKLVPEVMSSGDLVRKVAHNLVESGHLQGTDFALRGASSQQKLVIQVPTRGLPSFPVKPFNKLFVGSGCDIANSSFSSCGYLSLSPLYEASSEAPAVTSVAKSLSRVVYLFSSHLLTMDNKQLMLGCLEALALLSEEYPPVLYPSAWSCHSSQLNVGLSGSHIGLITQVLSLAGEASLAGDLTVQQHILTIAANLLAGICVEALRSTSEDVNQSKLSWGHLNSNVLRSVAEAVVEHLMRVLCVYSHVLEDQTPGAKAILPPLQAPAGLSPIKRKTRAESAGEKGRSHSPGKGEKIDEERERKNSKSMNIGSFAHLPEYIKLYDMLKNAHTNYKMSLDTATTDKLCGLLKVCLRVLGRLLEVGSCVEFGPMAEELLHYLKCATVLMPTATIQCGQQLLKCLFGSNVMALFEQLVRGKGNKSGDALPPSTMDSLPLELQEDSAFGLYHRCFMVPLAQLQTDLNAASEIHGDNDPISLGIQRKGSSGIFKTLTRNNDKSSLSSFIRLFEPLVIKSLKLYTVSSDVSMQQSVLQLLIHLVQIRVNYCLLDSDQIFIGYVIKQFEYIEEGQIKNAEILIPSMFRFLVLLSYERHHSKSIIGVPKIIQLCDGLMASGQPPLGHCVIALGPLVEDLFLVRSTTSSSDQRELETQREVLCSMLLRLSHYHQILRLLSLVLGSTKDNGERWRKLSRQVVDTVLPQLSRLQINLDSKESLRAVEEVLNSVCPSVYRPVDCVLKALFTSPCELESTSGVERWVGGVLLMLRCLISHSASDLVLSRLEELGLSMDYVHTDTSAEYSASDPLGVQEMQNQHSSNTFRDPLNVTQPETAPHMAMGRFLLEVIRVSVSEIRSVRTSMVHGSGSSGESRRTQQQQKLQSNPHSPDLLVHLTHHLLLTLVYLSQSGEWPTVVEAMRIVCVGEECEVMEEVSEGVVFVCGRHPALTMLWCKLLTLMDVAPQSLWTQVLRTTQRKSVAQHLSPVSSEASGPSSCLALEFMRRSGLLVFSQFVVRHMQEGEWLTWLVVQHISDVVLLHKEPPIRSLIQKIHSTPAASALLIQAIHARCEHVQKGEYGGHIISLVSGVHVNQSGALITFLVERLLSSPYLVVTRAASSLAAQRTHLLLAMDPQQVQTQFPQMDITKILNHMKETQTHKRYGQLYSLLQRLLGQVYEITMIDEPSLAAQPVQAPANTKLNLNWYLQVIRSRCQAGEGGGFECSQLLSQLDYSDIIGVMSGKTFNLKLLKHTLRLGLSSTLQANRQWGDCNSSVDTGDDSEECSSGSGSGEAPLYTASKVVLLQHLQLVAQSLPKPHHTFTPGGGNKYSERVCKLLSGDDTISGSVETLAPVLVEFLTSMAKLPWAPQIHPDTSEHVLRFALLAMEYLHWRVWLGGVSLEVASLCLQCVDAVMKVSSLAGLLGLPERLSYICSMTAATHATTVHMIKPRALPSLPHSLWQKLSGVESCPLTACKRLMQLLLWLENSNSHDLLPPCIAQPIKGVIMGLGRMPILNSVVRIPPDVWTMGWSPEFCGDHGTLLPPLPQDLLQETDVLKQFIFRQELFGWIGRQQFEETWMALLSVLNGVPTEDTPREELPYINLSLSLAVRGITALLVQTLLLPCPGNPHSGQLLHLPRDRPPTYLASKSGRKLQEVLSRLNEKLSEIQHLTAGGGRKLGGPPYQVGQVSLEYMVTALNSHADPPDSPDAPLTTGCYEFEMRERQLASCGLDVQSCVHFLHYHYSSWLKPQSGLCASVVGEVVKSVCCLCDLFINASHHRWVLETLVPLHSSHPIEDHITAQYTILAVCKALATLKTAKEDVASWLSEGVVHMVEAGLKSGQASVRTCSVEGLLYLFQGPMEDSLPLVVLAASYIQRYNDGKSVECERHEIAVWKLWVYLVEHYDNLPDPTLPSTALHLALSTAATPSTSPRLLRQVLTSVERLVLVQHHTTNTVEVIFKLVMDLVLNGSPSTSLTALPLFITALYANVRNNTTLPALQADMASDPETLLLVMEKLGVLFDRIRVGYPHEAWVIAGLLGPTLLDVLPASQILNKVITEYISSHQPHPHLLACTLFQVFEGAMSEGGEGLVQEWVLLSLSNFTQRSPVSLAVWCLTCFFIAASSNRWLRAAFPSVQASLGHLMPRDIQIFCLSASQFRQSLPHQEQKVKFDAVFQAVATPGSPFAELLDCIKD